MEHDGQWGTPLRDGGALDTVKQLWPYDEALECGSREHTPLHLLNGVETSRVLLGGLYNRRAETSQELFIYMMNSFHVHSEAVQNGRATHAVGSTPCPASRPANRWGLGMLRDQLDLF